jgi:hypothetical protein
MGDNFKDVLNESLQSSDEALDIFSKITERLIDVMVDYSVLTLNAFSRKKGSKLTDSQIRDAINFNLQFILQQVQDPEFLDIIRDETTLKYSENE